MGSAPQKKQLISVILACDTWGETWKDRRIHCYCGNQVVVACIRSRTSRYDGRMHLLHFLTFVEAKNQSHLHPVYIDTMANHLADDLSRNNASQRCRELEESHPGCHNLLHKLPGDCTSPT